MISDFRQIILYSPPTCFPEYASPPQPANGTPRIFPAKTTLVLFVDEDVMVINAARSGDYAKTGKIYSRRCYNFEETRLR
jgi:hypothetical protein